MTQIAQALKVSRQHMSDRLHNGLKGRGRYNKPEDLNIVERIKALIKDRPYYGYRRVHAMLNRQKQYPRLNHKRVYRLMKVHGLLMDKRIIKDKKPHTGKIITIHSNTRWCTDIFEIKCWNGEKVHVAFALDCHDREILGYVAQPRHLNAEDIQYLMLQSLEYRFKDIKTPHPIQWLSDNGGQFTADETIWLGKECGFHVRTTPAYSPESNGMAEAFVKTIKRDYVYVNDVYSAEQVMNDLPRYFEDYNEVAPHKGLNMLSPRMFLRAKSN